MLRCAIACAAASLASLWSTEIHFSDIPKPVIDERLRLVGKTTTERHDTVRALFEKAGCGDHISEQPVKHAKTPNVICTFPGASDSSIVVGAHYDFVNRGAGVIDNWSGASMLSRLYEGLKTAARKHTYIFISFTDEEAGLVGSRYYASHLQKDELQKISAMVNLDSLGTGTTEFEMDRADKRLAHALSNVAGTFKLPLSIMNVHRVGKSDSDSFEDRKVPTIMLHSITQQSFPLLHTPGDQMSAIHVDEYYDSYRLIQAYLAYLD